MSEFLCTIRRVLMTKIETEKAACLARSRLCVVEPHSMSTLPFCSMGMRFCEVTGTCRMVSDGSLSSRRNSSTALSASS